MLLPWTSRRGLITATPNWEGASARMPPDTPLLAGSPTRRSQDPEPSYIPQLVMRETTSRAVRAEITFSPVTGLRPPKARVPAITDTSVTVTSVAHWRKYASTLTCGSPWRMSYDRRRWASARLRSAVADSDAYTSSSTVRLRPAKAESPATMRAERSSRSVPGTRPVTAIAPALMSGLAGRPVDSSRLMALNGSPLGSTPTWRSTSSRPRASSTSAKTNGFEIDWMENSASASPTAIVPPAGPVTARASREASARASSGM